MDTFHGKPKPLLKADVLTVNSQGSPKGGMGGNHYNPNFCCFFLSRNYYLALVTNTEFKVLESSNGLETNMCQLLQKAL